MCGGGGSGGLDATTQDLQRYQLEQAKNEDDRLAAEQSRQQQAKNAIRVLYGYEPQAYENMISQDQKNAIYAYYDNNNKKPVLQSSADPNSKPSIGGVDPSTETDKKQYEQAMKHWSAGRDKYYQAELAKLMSGVDMSAQSADAKKNAAARQAGYDQIRTSNMAIMNSDIARNRADAERALKFGLARSSLTGGSVDIDENKNILDANQRSTVQANQLADNQVQQVRAQDEADYANSIQKINAGLDADTAITAATAAVKNNRDQAISDPTSSSLNNLFSSVGNFWNNYEYSKAAANPYGTASTGYTTNGSKGRIS